MSQELIAKQYDPTAVEERLYEHWEQSGYFRAEADLSKKPFTIVMPPPNITGQLHMGHALDNTLQDAIIRFKRMQGYAALWLPGTDHASIATEAKIVEAMKKEGLTKEQIGREAFLERAWAWKKQYGGRIVSQLRKLGSSCDWSRERFTMDEGCSKAVNEVFVKLYNEGLIYRGERIINWCPHCLTSISDAEVNYEDQAGHFWHLRYPFADGSGYLQLATTRPETLLGDTAVAVNPNDERYRELVGKMLVLPIVHREIPVVADDYVEMDFGTGVVKITPAHDPNDFEVGLRHNLPVINVMTPDAKITEDYSKYAGMDRYEARKAIVKDLEEEGALVKVEDYSHNVGTCYRCGTTVEPRISKQWFVKMKPLAEPAIEAVKKGETRFVPDYFEKTYFHWLENIRDWCISRQLWWGHRIPAYYCDECGETVVAKEKPNCPCCGKEMRQDPDTLDTWFSSALWPFSTLGWPNENADDFKYFYPTNTLVTGYDIIPFWVMRMMFSGIAHTGKAPFDTVLIHGLVRDSQGRKMSKSLGNGIDPLEVIDKYGADALRFSLAMGNSPGNDMRFYWEKVEAYRNFANKIWNASRFVMMNLEQSEIKPIEQCALDIADSWILSRYHTLAADVTENMEKFELGIAAQKLYDFIWSEYCDWYIELCKPRLYSDPQEKKCTALSVLCYVLSGTMQLLHPFMPFITEEIWMHLPGNGQTIMLSKWPEGRVSEQDKKQEAVFAAVIELIKAIRNLRAEMNVSIGKKISAYIIASENAEQLRGCEMYVQKLAGIAQIQYISERPADANRMAVTVTACAQCYIPLGDLIDIDKEKERLNKEVENLNGELRRASGKLANEGFVAKAPQNVIAAEREKVAKYTDMLAKVQERLKALEEL